VRRITLEAPEVRRDGASFRWQVEPATELYRASAFTLRLPAGLDARQVPESLWWTVALLCLHSHWPLLRPCSVRLPVCLEPGHRETWSRLLEAEVATLEAYRTGGAGEGAGTGRGWGSGLGGAAPGAGVELIDDGPRIAPPPRLFEQGRCAAAFSGGKDSLLQAALLSELGMPTLLVTTTSPMPPLADHQTERRRRVLAEIVRRRRDLELAEVATDLRACWRNDFPPRVGYPVAVNEITDTFLYTAALLVVAALRGATHLFLASEAEVQENVEIGGRTVQHTHFMYSAATMGAIAALLAPAGMRYGSLISALYSSQVQQLLWHRYGDLCDLQYSCWRVGAGEATCSRCSQCLRVALGALAAGGTPERMGIDLLRLLPAMRDWTPDEAAAPGGAAAAAETAVEAAVEAAAGDGPAAAGGAPAASPGPAAGAGPILPAAAVSRRLRRQVVRSLAAVSTARLAAALVAGGPGRLLRASGWRALAAYAGLRRRLVLAAPGGAAELLAESSGLRAGYLRLVDPLLRARIGAIFATHFQPESAAGYAGALARSEQLSAWIAAPLRLAADGGPAAVATAATISLPGPGVTAAPATVAAGAFAERVA
jgi:hypothetical protein